MPILESKLDLKVFLIQTFFPNSPGLKSNRGRLGEWTANKLRNLLNNRFEYYKLVIKANMDVNELQKIKSKLNSFSGNSN